MRAICLYFKVHQPIRLRQYRFFDIGKKDDYYDDYSNEMITRRVSDQCYLPANYILLQLIRKYDGRFKVSFSISGTAIDQFKAYAPDLIESFRKLAETGCVEFLSETNCHSLSVLKNETEFRRQVAAHTQEIETLFGIKPTVFVNTELVYSDAIGAIVADMGFKATLTEGSNHILQWRSPNYLYRNAIEPGFKVLLKNHQLSDDIAFRFSNASWSEWPLTTRKYVSWLKKIPKEEKLVNLFMNYETFGEHHKFGTGIFKFLDLLPSTVYRKTDFEFLTPSQMVENYEPISTLQVPNPISWADEERNLSAWLGNELQKEAFDKLYRLSDRISRIQNSIILKDWQYLQTSDHFYYMSTKYFSDGDIHAYFNPYSGPYEAFINYMNILNDFSNRLNRIKSSYSDQFTLN